MPYPGSTYGYDLFGGRMIWDAVRPPDGWVWCPGGRPKRARIHYKPNDGAPCLTCGHKPKKRRK